MYKVYTFTTEILIAESRKLFDLITDCKRVATKAVLLRFSYQKF